MLKYDKYVLLGVIVEFEHNVFKFAHLISEQIARFLSKNERMSDSLIFGEQSERFAHDRSFPLNDLSE